MDWHIGQRVVCVKTGFSVVPPIELIEQPVVGRVYTIRGFNLPTPECPELYGTGVGFYLEEIHTPKYKFTDGWREISYDQSGFKPTKKTDISIFEAMLATTGNKVKV